MTRIARYFVFAVLAAAAFAAQAAGLTEQSIMQMMKTMDAAIARKNAQAVADMMSPSVAIRMVVTAGGQTQTLTPNRDQYLQLLKEGWAVSTDYKYSRSGVKINLIDAGKATVKATIRETMKVQGHPVAGVSEEEVTIEMVDGKALITKVAANSKM